MPCFGEWRWGWFPFVRYSPAMLILIFPLSFRMTCYYYRGAYYKAFWADPPNCAVGEPRTTYRGEAKLPLIVQNVHRYALYFALVFIVLLSIDAWHGLWFEDPAGGGTHFGIGVGSLVLIINIVLIGGYTLGCHSLRHLVGRRAGSIVRGADPEEGLRLRELPEPASPQMGLVQPVLGRDHRRLYSVVFDGCHYRLENFLDGPGRIRDPDPRTRRHRHRRGRRGIARRDRGLGRRRVGRFDLQVAAGQGPHGHGGGGMAAAMANVDDRDSWKVHFADTMRGGQYVNNWRMAELHAQEAPARVRELEAWGAVFDRTPDGKILQRNFGGHRYPRLAHVGDRTGLEMIRTLQDHGIHQGIQVYMEHTVTALLKDGDRVAGAFGYDRERGYPRVFRAGAVVLATGGIGRAFKITSNSWEYTGDGHSLAYQAGADLMDMEFVQFHPTGMVWPPSVRGILVTEGVRGEGGVLRNSQGKRFMFDDIPENYRAQTADNPEEGWRYTQGDKAARRPPELLTRDHVARCIMREVRDGRGSPHGGVFLDIAWIKEKLPNAREHIKKKLPSMYHQFMQLAELDITVEPMEVGPTTHYVMGGVRVDGDTQMSTVPGLFAAGEVAAGLHGANRLGGNSLSDLLVFGKRAGESAAKFAKERGAGPDPR